MSLYTVVEFLTGRDKNTVAVISSHWLNDDQEGCFWPAGTYSNISKLVLEHASVGSNWKLCPCRVIKNFGSYEAARDYSAELSSLETSSSSHHQQLKEAQFEKERRKRKRSRPPGAKASAKRPPSLGLVTSTPSPSQVVLNPSISDHNRADSSSSSDSEKEESGPEDRRPVLVNSAAPLRTLLTPVAVTTPTTSHSATTVRQGGSGGLDRGTNNQSLFELVVSIQQEQRKFQEKVLRRLMKVEENQLELLRRTAEPNPGLAGSHPRSPQLPVSVPVKTILELEALNNWLGSGDNLKNYSVDLAIIGGTSGKNITHRILDTLLTNTVGKDLSLTGIGKKTKAGFKGTPLLQLLYDTVRITKQGQNTELKEIDQYIQAWLKGAGDRDGGRRERGSDTSGTVAPPTTAATPNIIAALPLPQNQQENSNV